MAVVQRCSVLNSSSQRWRVELLWVLQCGGPRCGSRLVCSATSCCNSCLQHRQLLQLRPPCTALPLQSAAVTPPLQSAAVSTSSEGLVRWVASTSQSVLLLCCSIPAGQQTRQFPAGKILPRPQHSHTR